MSKQQSKFKIRGIFVVGFLILTFSCLFLLLFLLSYYNKNNWSTLYFEADLTRIYGNSLNELKDAYKEIKNLDYYEVNNQFLEITNKTIPDEFLYGYEYGNIVKQKNKEGNIVYQTKCFQLSENCFSRFDITVEEGRIFCDEDMICNSTKSIPMIVGSEYAADLKIGDILVGKYIQNELTYEVIGILDKDANINLGGKEVNLDRYLLIPSFDMMTVPKNESEELFQVRHYANKLSGKLYYNSFSEFVKCYIRIDAINRNVLVSEGKIIF